MRFFSSLVDIHSPYTLIHQYFGMTSIGAGSPIRAPGNNSRIVNDQIAVARLSNYGVIHDLGGGLSGTVCLVKHARTGETLVAKAMKWENRKMGEGA